MGFLESRLRWISAHRRCYIQEQYLWKEGMKPPGQKSNCHSVSANPRRSSELTQGDETLYPNRDDLLGAGSSQGKGSNRDEWLGAVPRGKGSFDQDGSSAQGNVQWSLSAESHLQPCSQQQKGKINSLVQKKELVAQGPSTFQEKETRNSNWMQAK